MSEGRMGARDWGLLVLLSLLWGAAFILTEVALRDLPPFTVVLGRIGLAALALNLFLLARGQRLPFEPRLWAAFFAMGALNNVLPFSLIVTGQVTIDGGLAAVLNATTPLFSLHDRSLYYPDGASQLASEPGHRTWHPRGGDPDRAAGAARPRARSRSDSSWSWPRRCPMPARRCSDGASRAGRRSSSPAAS